ncbi:ribosomal maturation YjgA family protein [Flammeovirga agarivorans]|uniref:DUF2809 domain-containing protein n=1 Tax=Flammeovirga agarivorans TaxID=2726742 RepID=A0A7X8SK43_9BACT|nr:DUF2809 domain-containing protein [Flammeovirga agarivorans]NLR91617.1 DUF2809 domain-containing protein [Flammeovirga agarivorans]
MNLKPQRNRIVYTFIIFLIISFGLLSRTSYIPAIIYPYLGDYLYAFMFYFITAWLFKSQTTFFVLIVSTLSCFFIETLQLYQAPWIVEIRNTTLGSLVLGHGFLWSDLVAYTFGCITGFLGEFIFYKKRLHAI